MVSYDFPFLFIIEKLPRLVAQTRFHTIVEFHLKNLDLHVPRTFDSKFKAIGLILILVFQVLKHNSYMHSRSVIIKAQLQHFGHAIQPSNVSTELTINHSSITL